MIYLPAFLIGLLGSLHCVGMCGPLVLAVPAGKVRSSRWYANRAVYQAGRLSTYAMLGAIIALAGKGIALAGWQQVLSVGAGIFLLMLAILPTQVERWAAGNGRVALWLAALRKKLHRFTSRGGWQASLLLGVFNGLLPCGLVYVGLTGAMLTGTLYGGAFWMLAFGLGTLPAMAFVLGAGSLITGKLRSLFRRAMPLAAGFLGLVLIIRGLGLGIPYLSPVLEWATRSIPVCGG